MEERQTVTTLIVVEGGFLVVLDFSGVNSSTSSSNSLLEMWMDRVPNGGIISGESTGAENTDFEVRILSDHGQAAWLDPKPELPHV